MARQVIKTSTALDRIGYRLVVDFYTGEYKGDIVDENHPGLRYATEVVRVIGPQYSYAFVGVPVNTFGAEWAPAVALQRNGPAGKVKLRSRARVNMIDYTGAKIPLLVGFTTQYAHSIDEDSVVAMVMDDRWCLSKVTAFGSACYDPAAQQSYFDAGRPLVFNAQGYPDCIDGPRGPMFAPGRLYGYKKSEEVEDKNEPSQGQAKTRARSWNCEDVLQYLRNMYYLGRRPPHPQNYGKQQVSQFINWPSSLGNQHGFNRIVRDFKCENLEVGECIARTCRKAGPYEILMEPDGWRGKIGIVQVNSRMGGSYLVGPRFGSSADGGDIAACLEDSTRIAGGTVMESIVGYFDDVCIAGDPPAIEHQFSVADPLDTELPVELEPGWTTDEETNFKKIIDDNGKDAAAFAMACQAEPRVYAAWRVSAGYAAYVHTHWGNDVQPNNPRILAKLLSGYAQGNNNPRDWNPRETVLEYLDPTAYGTFEWKPCSRFDDLTIVDEGKAFQVEALRSGSDPVTFHGDPSDTTLMGANSMRITCAVEREFRIVGTAKSDPNNTAARVNNPGDKFTFLAVAEDGDYSHWERYLSRPNGNSVKEPELSQLFPDACETAPGSGNKWLFSDLLDTRGGTIRIQRHADHRIEDVKKIDYHGILTMHTWNPGIKPGMQVIIDIGGNSISPKAIIRCVKFNSQTQSQEIELMAGDNATIYDVPLPPPPQTAGGSPSPTGTAGPKTGPNMGSSGSAETSVTTSGSTGSPAVTTSGADQASSSGKPSSTSTGANASVNEKGEKIYSQGLTEEEWNDKYAGKESAKDTVNYMKSRNEDADAAKAEKAELSRRKAGIVHSSISGEGTGRSMSAQPDESNYTKEANAKRAEAKEQALMDKALRKSVKKDIEAYEEE